MPAAPEARRRAPLDHDRFRRPPMTDRPGMRWWWQSPVPAAELVHELGAIAAAGFGEVEIGFSPGFWADDAQRDALGAVLEEAERLGIGVAVTLGAAWPLQTPNTTTGTAYAAQELQYGVADLTAGRVGLPAPIDDLSRDRPARLLAATAARVVDRGSPPTVVDSTSSHGPRKEIHPPEVSTVLAADSLLDLTALVTDDAVDWPARDGDWVLFALWLRDCEQGVTSFLDRRACVAAAAYLDDHQLGPANLDRLRRTGTELFEDSLEYNAMSLFWSPALLDRYVGVHGYDPTPMLPLLFAHGMCRYWVPNEEPVPDFELDTGAGGTIRHDYYRVLTDLYVSEHLQVLQQWSAGHGLQHKSQAAYGQNLEPIRSHRELVRVGGRSEGESLNSGDRMPVRRDHPNWRFALDWQRCVVGGAHQGGAVRVSTELGAQFQEAYAVSLGDYRQLLDKEWAAGITKPFVHGFASQEAGSPWPTQARFWDVCADSWNDTHFPEWPNWRPLTDYWARGVTVLETGTPRTDVAIHRDGFLTTAARGTLDLADDWTAPARLFATDDLERAGFSVQYVDPVGLAERSVGVDGALFPDGPAYRALVIAEPTVTAEAAEAIDQAAARGLRVVIVGDPPDRDPGFERDGRSQRVRAAVAALLQRPTVRRVDHAYEVGVALRDLALLPRVQWSGPPLLTQWREAGDHRYVLVYNPEPVAHTVQLSLEGSGGVDELDLVTGDVRAVGAAVSAGRTGLAVDLAALGVRVFDLTLARDPLPPPEPASLPHEPVEGREPTLTDWRLEVITEEQAGPRVIVLDGQGPADWRTVPELAGVSGTGRYTARAAGDQPAATMIDLGALGGSAVVRIADQVFGPAYVSGTVLHLGAALRPGDIIEIEVRTPLRNAVVAAGTSPNLGPRTRPQGLIGPVTLRPAPVSPVP